jgi:hypothetical protein
MRIDSSGNVGIGTTSPASGLELVSNTGANIFSTTYADNLGGGNFVGRKARGTRSAPTGALADDQLSVLLARGYTSASAFSGNVGAIGVYAAENFTGTNNGTYVAFATTAIGATSRTERMRITSAGNVGIGASSPAGRLAVAGTGSGSTSPEISFENQTATTGRTYAIISGDGGPLRFQDVTAGAERMRIASDGNVGIGTTSPSVKLDVIGTIYSRPGGAAGAVAELTADASSGANGISLIAGFTSGGYGPIKLLTSATERMRIGSNGSVAIGGTGTDASLHIQQAYGGYDRLTQISPSATSKNAFNIMAAKDAGSSDLWWSWGVRTDNVWALQSGVNYSLNGALGFFFDSAGAAFKSGGGTWSATSDARVKTNILPISDAASRIMALKPCNFDYRAPEAHAGRVSDRGFIAQDFAEIYPHSVSESDTVCDAEKAFLDEGGKIKAVGLNNDFFADIVALVQEQHNTINALTARVAQLEATTPTIKFEGE